MAENYTGYAMDGNTFVLKKYEKIVAIVRGESIRAEINEYITTHQMIIEIKYYYKMS